MNLKFTHNETNEFFKQASHEPTRRYKYEVKNIFFSIKKSTSCPYNSDKTKKRQTLLQLYMDTDIETRKHKNKETKEQNRKKM